MLKEVKQEIHLYVIHNRSWAFKKNPKLPHAKHPLGELQPWGGAALHVAVPARGASSQAWRERRV